MKRKQLLSISASVLAAAWIASDAGLVLAQSSGEKKDKSVGGSQSERTGSDSETPLTDKKQMGTGEKGTGSTEGSSSKGAKGTKQSGTKDSKTIHPDVNESVGGSKSERGSGGTPLPEKSPSTGTVEKGSGSSR